MSETRLGCCTLDGPICQILSKFQKIHLITFLMSSTTSLLIKVLTNGEKRIQRICCFWKKSEVFKDIWWIVATFLCQKNLIEMKLLRSFQRHFKGLKVPTNFISIRFFWQMRVATICQISLKTSDFFSKTTNSLNSFFSVCKNFD